MSWLPNLTPLFSSANRNNSQVNMPDMQQPCTIINISDSENEKVHEKKDKFCEISTGRKLDKIESELEDILEGLSKNWLNKTIFSKYLEEIKGCVNKAESIISDVRDILQEHDAEKKQEIIEKAKSDINEIIESIDTNSPSNHDILNGSFDLMTMFAMAAWTYLANNNKLDESKSDYLFIPLALNASPNTMKLLILLKNKIIRFYLDRRENLKTIFNSMLSILKECEDKNTHEEDKNIIREAENNIILRLSQEIKRQSISISIDQRLSPNLSTDQEVFPDAESINNYGLGLSQEIRRHSVAISIDQHLSPTLSPRQEVFPEVELLGSGGSGSRRPSYVSFGEKLPATDLEYFQSSSKHLSTKRARNSGEFDKCVSNLIENTLIMA